MNTFSILLVMAATSGLLVAENATLPANPNDSMAEVLKMDSYLDLAEKHGETSECGQDYAAKLHANAVRIQTETRLASTSMERVIVLGMWRDALDRWDDLGLEVVILYMGGGSMWGHQMMRNNDAIEEFLSPIAGKFGVTAVDLKPKTIAELDKLLKVRMTQISQAKAQAVKRKEKPQADVAELTEKLKENHAQLVNAFKYTGDDTTTQILLDWCKRSTASWDALTRD